MQGWIKLHRKIQDHWLYQERRKFSKYEAWIDLLMMASHKDTKFVHGSELIELEKGSFVTSELKLMERWDWGKSKLRSFLEILEKDGMIVKNSDRKKTTINICNYSGYHESETESRLQTDHEQTTGRLSADTIKNVKNVKNEKEKIPYVEIVFYLNEKTGKKFSHKSEANKRLINGRFSEGRTLEDFKQVIDLKCEQWLNNSDMNKYLRPDTLFSQKNFEKYVNEKPKMQSTQSTDPRDTDIEFQRFIAKGGNPEAFVWK